MASIFDPALIEATYLIKAHLIHVYKVGGGAVGRRYKGRWAYRIKQAGRIVSSTEELFAEAHRSHQEVAALALDETQRLVGEVRG